MILILIIAGLIVLIYIFVKYFPVWIVKKRAEIYCIFIKRKEAHKLIRMGCVSNKFFKIYSQFIEQDHEIDVLELASHKSAGGDLEKALAALVYARKNNLLVGYKEILMLNLMGGNIVEKLKERACLYT